MGYLWFMEMEGCCCGSGSGSECTLGRYWIVWLVGGYIESYSLLAFYP